MQTLIDWKADLNVKDRWGNSPLDDANHAKNTERPENKEELLVLMKNNGAMFGHDITPTLEASTRTELPVVSQKRTALTRAQTFRKHAKETMAKHKQTRKQRREKLAELESKRFDELTQTKLQELIIPMLEEKTKGFYNAVRASYRQQYENHSCSEEALVILNDAASTASEFWLEERNWTQNLLCPFRAEFEEVCRKAPQVSLEHTKKIQDTAALKGFGSWQRYWAVFRSFDKV
jgi:hypothetical protein